VLRVIRSVTILNDIVSTMVHGTQTTCHTHPLIESFAFSDKNSVSFDEIRIDCLREREDDVPDEV